MIIGHGIDLQDISAIQQAYEKNPKFAQRILTEAEFRRFSEHTNLKRQMAFLAGRWAGKEAFAKAMGTGIGKLRFQNIEILNNSQGAPVITRSPFSGRTFISISHSGDYAQASVILEDDSG